jgi:putative ABC transport system permease protein
MYILKNAVKNIGRNKGRNILMAVIIFAIILTTTVSIIINTTTAAIIKDYKARFGSEVSINSNYEKIQKAYSEGSYSELEKITVKQYIAFGESDLLKSKEYTATVYVGSDKWKALDEGETGGISIIGGDREDYLTPKAKVIGSTDISDDFKNGLRKIISGEMFKNLDECIVSEQFAKLNSLAAGDKIKVNSSSKKNPMTHELTITGIYEDNTIFDEKPQFKSPFTNRGNEILTSAETAINMEMIETAGAVTAKYFLKDPSLLEDYRAELKAKGLSDYYVVSTDEASYNKIVGPVDGLAKITDTFLIAVLALGSVILILLSSLAIRERKYEIGVLRAMGMKKGKVAFGLLSEMLVITGLCLVLGLGVGISVSQPVSDTLLKNQIQIIEENNKKASVNNGGLSLSGVSVIGGNVVQVEPLSELKVSLNIDAVGQIIFISILLAGISSLIGILYITKFEPMKILSERN